MPYKNFLGYDKSKDGKPVINEKEAEIVRLIYRLFLQGKTVSGICKHLDGLGTPTPTGRKAWNQTTINSILRNEKYKGDALLQKKFTVDFLTKKQKVNEGEIPQYYVEDNHPAIIDPFEFDMVQAEIARQQKLGRSYSGASIFFKQGNMRWVLQLLRSENPAFQRPLSQSCVALQQKVQRKVCVRNSDIGRWRNQRKVYYCV